MSNPKLQSQVNDRCRFRDVGFNLRWFGRRGVALAGIALVIAPELRARAATLAPEPPAAAEPAAPAFQPPRLTHFVEAVPPPMADRSEAEVVLTIDIDEAGKVTKVEVAKPAGGEAGEALDRAAVEAARQFVFEPGRAEGRPVPVRITYSYKFVLKPPPPPAAPPSGAGTATSAPTVPVSGIVRRRGDCTPVAGVTVIVVVGPGDERRATTDEAGRFAFLCPAGRGAHPRAAGARHRSDVDAGRSASGQGARADHLRRRQAAVRLDRARPPSRRRDHRAHAVGRRDPAHSRHPGRHAQGGAEPARRGAGAVRHRPAAGVGLGAAGHARLRRRRRPCRCSTTSVGCARR